MQNGRKHTPIPPNLHELLGKPHRTIDAEPHWALNHVAAAIGCKRQCFQNWISNGMVPEATYDLGRWWIPLRTVNYLRTHGPAPVRKFGRLTGRTVVRHVAPDAPPTGNPT